MDELDGLRFMVRDLRRMVRVQRVGPCADGLGQHISKGYIYFGVAEPQMRRAQVARPEGAARKEDFRLMGDGCMIPHRVLPHFRRCGTQNHG